MRDVTEVPASLDMKWTLVESPHSPPPSNQHQQLQQPIPVISLTTAIKQPIVLVPTTCEQNYELMNKDTTIVELVIAECERTGCCPDEVVNAVRMHCLEQCISDTWRVGIVWTTHHCMAHDSGY